MAKKAKRKSKKNNNNLMAWVFVALFLLIVISIAVILTLNNGSDPNTNESFFVSDESKYVIASELGDSGKDGNAVSAYDIYYYSGETITGHKAYFEFINEEAAKEALPDYQSLQDNEIKSVEVNGRYIVFTAEPSQYEKITLEQVKEWSSVNSEEE